MVTAPRNLPPSGALLARAGRFPDVTSFLCARDGELSDPVILGKVYVFIFGTRHSASVSIFLQRGLALLATALG